MHDEVRTFFHAVGVDLDAIAATYPRDVIAGTTDLVTAMTAVLTEHLPDMR